MLLVGAGSAAGAVSRVAAGSLADAQGPASTLAVNIAGCFLFGLLAPVFSSAPRLARWWPLVGPGFLGGFTTFSAFIVLVDGLSPAGAAVLVAATVVGCPVAAWLGGLAGDRASASRRGRRSEGPAAGGGPGRAER